MTSTKLKMGIAGVLVIAGIAITLVFQSRRHTRLNRENLVLRQQVAQLNQIREAVERLPELPSDPQDSEAARKHQQELLRLRGAIAAQRRQEGELRQKLEAAENQTDLAKLELNMVRRRPAMEGQSSEYKATAWPDNFEIARLQPAGRATAVNAAQSALYAVFHGGVDAYYELTDSRPIPDGAQSATTLTKNESQDRVFKEKLAQMRLMWGGDAAQGIKNLKMGPLNDGLGENRYVVGFMIDYGASGRPTGAPTHGSITLHQTPDGWKEDGFGSDIDPETP
jgi:hypothetical protein